MSKGWRNEAARHSLAARGVKTRPMPRRYEKWIETHTPAQPGATGIVHIVRYGKFKGALPGDDRYQYYEEYELRGKTYIIGRDPKAANYEVIAEIPGHNPSKSASSNIWDGMWKYHSKSYDEMVDWYKKNLPERDYLGDTRKNFFDFEYAPVRDVDKLIEKNPRVVSLNERQNNSPTMRKMLDIARQYNGTLNGYAIPPESGRNDTRVTFTGFELPIDKETAKKLKRSYRPDEFNEIKPGLWRFWWD